MSTLYIMEAVNNYNALYGPQVSNNTAPFNCIPDQLYAGMSFDAVRRKIMFVAYVCPQGNVTNDTGHALWNGTDSIAIGASYLAADGKNLFICELDVDTRVVTWYDAWSPTSVVPASVFGDGTARRYTDTSTRDQGPKVVDPRTGNVWMHAFGTSITCSIYLFRRADAFQQIISPLTDAGQHMTIRGMQDDWVFVTREQLGVGDLALTPREITAAETTADYLLAYATFALPGAFDHSYNAAVTWSDGNMYWFTVNQSGARQYKLFKFTKPSAFVYPTPPVDGGFTDVTPWGGSTGPNSDVAGYTVSSLTNGQTECIAFKLPATGDLALVSWLRPQDTGAGVTNPLLWRLDCTYVHLAGPTFDYHKGFVTGYMKADWTPTTDPMAAAWSVLSLLQTNIYRDTDSHDYGGNYVRRRFYFQVAPVVGGVVNSSFAVREFVLATYDFVSGAAPALVSFHNESSWDNSYPGFKERYGSDNPMWWAITGPTFVYELWSDIGLYDEATDSWWTSSYDADAAYYLNPIYQSRADFDGFGSAPFLRLSFGETAANRRSSVRIMYQRKPA